MAEPTDVSTPRQAGRAGPADGNAVHDERREALQALWADALWAAALTAIDPAGLGGVALRAAAGPVRDRWLDALRCLSAPLPMRRVPLNIADDRLLGGIDLAATLQAGRPVAQQGVLAQADGGIVLLAMAERLPGSALAHWTSAMDQGELRIERDGLSLRCPARFGVVALDEGLDDDEVCAPALLDRLAFHLDLSELGLSDLRAAGDAVGAADAAAVQRARALWPSVQVEDGGVATLCQVASALGIASLRAPLLALRAARASAALDGRCLADADDLARAARLVLAPRATVLPAPPVDPDPPDPAEAAPDPAEADNEPDPSSTPGAPPPNGSADAAPADPPPAPPPGVDPAADPDPSSASEAQALEDHVLEATRAAIPAGLLARLRAGLAPRASTPGGRSGRAGDWQAGAQRGRPAGVRRGAPRAGARLDLIATLREAAPWQTVRRAERARHGGTPRRVEVRSQDFHTRRTEQRRETTTIFAVDASGSAALARLAETKGAVELLLADCYVRRDRVAVLGFRGRASEVLLPPTRSLVRAKRSLAGLPGGGGTPLAAGIDAALALAQSVRRRGDTPVVVLLTDGRANVARSGLGGRAQAHDDALHAAQQLRATGVACLLIDTSPQPGPHARRVAEAMGARYLPLPRADAAELSRVIQQGSAAVRR